MEDKPNEQNINNTQSQTPEGITEIKIDGKNTEANINEILLMLENTIQINFDKNEYTKIKTSKELLNYFYSKEKSCLNKLDVYHKSKKKLYKIIIYESINEIFKQCQEGLTKEIMDKLNEIRKDIKKNNYSLDDFYKKLEEKLGNKNIPKFLIRKDLKYVKFTEKIKKNEEYQLKIVLEYYQQLVNQRIIPFNGFKDKNLLFNVFVLSNAKEIGNDKLIEEIFCANYAEIRSWFGLSQDFENYQNIFSNFIDIQEIEQKDFLNLFINQIEELINQNKNEKDLYLLIITSFFYCIVHNLEYLRKDNVEINDVNSKTTIFLKNIIETISVYIKSYKYNIKKLINYLFTYVLSNKNNKKGENCINDNDAIVKSLINSIDKVNIFIQEENIDYDFLLIEEIISHSNDENLKQRFEQIKSKFNLEPSYEFSKSLVSSIFSKVTNYLTSKNSYYANYIRLSPFQKHKSSNLITILISGFGSENDTFSLSWKIFIDNDPTNTTYYFYRWPGDSSLNIFLKSLPLSLGHLVFNTKLPQIFKESKERAANSGKLLALILKSRKFFGDKKINLVGFSLGCHVIKFCLKELGCSDEGKNIINNVLFLGGATTFKNKSSWFNLLNKIVKGRIINCFSKKDEVLKNLYTRYSEKDPIGGDKLDINDGRGGKTIVENYDFTDIDLGHLEYRKYFNVILKRINTE